MKVCNIIENDNHSIVGFLCIDSDMPWLMPESVFFSSLYVSNMVDDGYKYYDTQSVNDIETPTGIRISMLPRINVNEFSEYVIGQADRPENLEDEIATLFESAIENGMARNFGYYSMACMTINEESVANRLDDSQFSDYITKQVTSYVKFDNVPTDYTITTRAEFIKELNRIKNEIKKIGNYTTIRPINYYVAPEARFTYEEVVDEFSYAEIKDYLQILINMHKFVNIDAYLELVQFFKEIGVLNYTEDRLPSTSEFVQAYYMWGPEGFNNNSNIENVNIRESDTRIYNSDGTVLEISKDNKYNPVALINLTSSEYGIYNKSKNVFQYLKKSFNPDDSIGFDKDSQSLSQGLIMNGDSFEAKLFAQSSAGRFITDIDKETGEFKKGLKVHADGTVARVSNVSIPATISYTISIKDSTYIYRVSDKFISFANKRKGNDGVILASSNNFAIKDILNCNTPIDMYTSLDDYFVRNLALTKVSQFCKNRVATSNYESSYKLYTRLGMNPIAAIIYIFDSYAFKENKLSFSTNVTPTSALEEYSKEVPDYIWDAFNISINMEDFDNTAESLLSYVDITELAERRAEVINAIKFDQCRTLEDVLEQMEAISNANGFKPDYTNIALYENFEHIVNKENNKGVLEKHIKSRIIFNLTNTIREKYPDYKNATIYEANDYYNMLSLIDLIINGDLHIGSFASVNNTSVVDNTVISNLANSLVSYVFSKLDNCYNYKVEDAIEIIDNAFTLRPHKVSIKSVNSSVPTLNSLAQSASLDFIDEDARAKSGDVQGNVFDCDFNIYSSVEAKDIIVNSVKIDEADCMSDLGNSEYWYAVFTIMNELSNLPLSKQRPYGLICGTFPVSRIRLGQTNPDEAPNQLIRNYYISINTIYNIITDAVSTILGSYDANGVFIPNYSLKTYDGVEHSSVEEMYKYAGNNPLEYLIDNRITEFVNAHSDFICAAKAVEYAKAKVFGQITSECFSYLLRGYTFNDTKMFTDGYTNAIELCGRTYEYAINAACCEYIYNNYCYNVVMKKDGYASIATIYDYCLSEYISVTDNEYLGNKVKAFMTNAKITPWSVQVSNPSGIIIHNPIPLTLTWKEITCAEYVPNIQDVCDFRTKYNAIAYKEFMKGIGNIVRDGYGNLTDGSGCGYGFAPDFDRNPTINPNKEYMLPYCYRDSNVLIPFNPRVEVYTKMNISVDGDYEPRRSDYICETGLNVQKEMIHASKSNPNARNIRLANIDKLNDYVYNHHYVDSTGVYFYETVNHYVARWRLNAEELIARIVSGEYNLEKGVPILTRIMLKQDYQFRKLANLCGIDEDSLPTELCEYHLSTDIMKSIEDGSIMDCRYSCGNVPQEGSYTFYENVFKYIYGDCDIRIAYNIPMIDGYGYYLSDKIEFMSMYNLVESKTSSSKVDLTAFVPSDIEPDKLKDNIDLLTCKYPNFNFFINKGTIYSRDVHGKVSRVVNLVTEADKIKTLPTFFRDLGNNKYFVLLSKGAVTITLKEN